MPRLHVDSVEAMRLAQTEFGLPDLIVSALHGCVPETVKANRRKAGWEIGSNLEQTDSVLRKQAEVVDGVIVIRTLPVSGASPQKGPEEGFVAELTREELRAAYDELALNIQREVVALLRSGTVMELERRHIARIEAMLKASSKLWQMLQDWSATEPELAETDEIAGVLKKMEDRIHDLAEQRYQQLVAERLHAGAAAEGRAGVAVPG